MKNLSLLLLSFSLLLATKAFAQESSDPIDPELSQIIDELSFDDGHIGHALVKTIHCEQYSGGAKKLIEDVFSAVKQGLTCMNSMGSSETKSETARLLGIFMKPKTTLTLGCGDAGYVVKDKEKNLGKLEDDFVAKALIPGDIGFPGALFVLRRHSDEYDDYYNRGITIVSSPAERKKAVQKSKAPFRGEIWEENSIGLSEIFHEMVHLTGIQHGQAFDTPYFAQVCCFDQIEGIDNATKDAACGLLKAENRPSLTSAEYLVPATKIFAKYNPAMAADNLLRMKFRAENKKGKVDPDFLKILYQAAQGLKGTYRERDIPSYQNPSEKID